jgi:glutaredoxin
MENQTPGFIKGLDKIAMWAFIGIVIIALCNSCTSAPQNLASINASEAALHESAHYIVYREVMKAEGLTPSPVEISILREGSAAGHFEAENYGNRRTVIVTYMAGYATLCVFGKKDPRVVFSEIKKLDTVDFDVAAKEIEYEEDEFAHFEAAIGWVEKFAPEIVAFATRLKKEKYIKF